jgi:predicted methyltransferase
MYRYALIAVSMAALAACGQQAEEPTPAETTAAASTSNSTESAWIEASITHPERLSGDNAEDEWRKPAAVLTFLQVRPGISVIDYMAGGGYYTELLSRIVGADGQVIAYNNAPYLKYAAEKPALRYDNERLPNVAQLTTAPEDLTLNPDSLDAALFVQSYHDLHWRSKDGSWPPTDPAAALAKLVPALKSGASVVVIDHVAAPGSDPAVSVDALHRIDPAVIKRDFEAAGLVFEAESDTFRNEEDDHTIGVFDPAIRHKTDQVMYRFRKP